MPGIQREKRRGCLAPARWAGDDKDMRRFGHSLLAFSLVGLTSACDPVPDGTFRPPGGLATPVDRTGRLAIDAVLYTPGYGVFRTVREGLSSYLRAATEAVEVHGWTAERVVEPVDNVQVVFAWHDGERERTAEWELNGWGVWPLNDEARYLSMYPPMDSLDE